MGLAQNVINMIEACFKYEDIELVEKAVALLMLKKISFRGRSVEEVSDEEIKKVAIKLSEYEECKRELYGGCLEDSIRWTIWKDMADCPPSDKEIKAWVKFNLDNVDDCNKIGLTVIHYRERATRKQIEKALQATNGDEMVSIG